MNTTGSFSAARVSLHFLTKTCTYLMFSHIPPQPRGSCSCPHLFKFPSLKVFLLPGPRGKVTLGTAPAGKLPSPVCLPPDNPRLASGTNSPGNFLEAFELSSSTFLVTSSYYPNSLQMQSHLQALCSEPSSPFLFPTHFVRRLLGHSTCLGHKEDAARSPVSLRAIDPRCHRPHWNSLEYAFGLKYAQSD